MSALAAVTLPTGVHAAGGWLRLATLSPMTGRDEVLLAEDDGRPLAQRVTALLAGCLLLAVTLPIGSVLAGAAVLAVE